MGWKGFFEAMLQKIDFREIIDNNPDLPVSGSNRRYKTSTIVEGFITSIWCGANRFLHTEVTRHDAALGKIFDWSKELKDKTKEVYKLTTVNNPTIIQGLLSIEDKQDHMFMHLIESSKFNKGKYKIYLGVAGNLVAFACKVSVDKGYQGFLAFDAKTALIKHYQETLQATHFRGLRMFIETNAALRLISQYFKS